MVAGTAAGDGAGAGARAGGAGGVESVTVAGLK